MSKPKKCVWTPDDYEDGYEESCWNTGCGETFILTTATPKENDMKYCCHCGKPLEEKL